MMVAGKSLLGRRLKMKVQTLVRKMYEAILRKDKEAEHKLWVKSIKKSLKHKKTYVIK
jgi:ribosomal protein S20